MTDQPPFDMFDAFLPPPAEDCLPNAATLLAIDSATPSLIVAQSDTEESGEGNQTDVELPLGFPGIESECRSIEDQDSVDDNLGDDDHSSDQNLEVEAVDEEEAFDDESEINGLNDEESEDWNEDDQVDCLTADEADVVERLSEWMLEVRAAADEVTKGDVDFSTDHDGSSIAGVDDHDDSSSPGLFRLVEEFTALRHDVKLQAKSSRGLQDQSDSLLKGLSLAIEQFQTVKPREQQAVREAMKTLIESMIDLDASLDRGRLAAEAARTRWLDESNYGWRELVDAELAAFPAWKRWFLRAISTNLASSLTARFAEAWSATQNAQVEGYRLIQNRLRRLLQQHDVEQIETLGLMTDPNLMAVIDLVDHDTLPAGTVVEELRPGYLWRGQLLRYAEVRVVRSHAESST